MKWVYDILDCKIAIGVFTPPNVIYNLLFMVAKHKSEYKSTWKYKKDVREMGEKRENELIGYFILFYYIVKKKKKNLGC